MKQRKVESFDELLEKLQQLQEQDVDRDGKYDEIVSVLKKLYQIVRQDRSNKYLLSPEYVKNQIVKYLVHYGTYLKTVYRKDDLLAEEKLQEALKYEKMLPIAYYRLGFLAYKAKNYVEAMNHFHQAIKTNELCRNQMYQLNELQQYYAHLYLENSALYIAEFAKKRAEQLNEDEQYSFVPNYEIANLYEVIRRNEQFLNQHAFRVLKQASTINCSKDEAEEYLEEEDHVILYFSDRENLLIYNDVDTILLKNHAEMLRFFMLNSRESEPLSVETFINDKEITRNAIIQRIRRLREKLNEIGLPPTIIQTSQRNRNEQGKYYYDQSFPYIIIHRTDHDFMLDFR